MASTNEDAPWESLPPALRLAAKQAHEKKRQAANTTVTNTRPSSMSPIHNKQRMKQRIQMRNKTPKNGDVPTSPIVSPASKSIFSRSPSKPPASDNGVSLKDEAAAMRLRLQQLDNKPSNSTARTSGDTGSGQSGRSSFSQRRSRSISIPRKSFTLNIRNPSPSPKGAGTLSVASERKSRSVVDRPRTESNTSHDTDAAVTASAPIPRRRSSSLTPRRNMGKPFTLRIVTTGPGMDDEDVNSSPKKKSPFKSPTKDVTLLQKKLQKAQRLMGEMEEKYGVLQASKQSEYQTLEKKLGEYRRSIDEATASSPAPSPLDMTSSSSNLQTYSYEILAKKLAKVTSMIEELDANAGRLTPKQQSDRVKWHRKRVEYQTALESMEEHRIEQENARKAQEEAEAARLAEEEKEASRRRAEEEAESAKLKAEEEARAEVARKIAEEEARAAKKKADEEAEHQRREAEKAKKKEEKKRAAEEAKRKAEKEAEAARLKAEEEAQAEVARRIAEEETRAAKKEAEEEAERDRQAAEKAKRREEKKRAADAAKRAESTELSEQQRIADEARQEAARLAAEEADRNNRWAAAEAARKQADEESRRRRDEESRRAVEAAKQEVIRRREEEKRRALKQLELQESSASMDYIEAEREREEALVAAREKQALVEERFLREFHESKKLEEGVDKNPSDSRSHDTLLLARASITPTPSDEVDRSATTGENVNDQSGRSYDPLMMARAAVLSDDEFECKSPARSLPKSTSSVSDDGHIDGDSDIESSCHPDDTSDEFRESKSYFDTMESVDSVTRNRSVDESTNLSKLLLDELNKLEARLCKLESQLTQNGIAIPDDVSFDVAKAKIEELMRELQEVARESSTNFDPKLQTKYYQLEEELAKYSSALMLTDEWAEEQAQIASKWEADIEEGNLQAIRKIRRHMPVDVRQRTEDELTTELTPNGKLLPKPLIRKFKRTNVLQLLRMNPDAIERMHPSLLEGLRTTGLTLTERRALHHHLKDTGAIWNAMKTDKSIERKWMWFCALKGKFTECLNAYEKHVEEYGPPGSHPYAKRNDPTRGGCPMIGSQCPVKADAAVDYSGDYGFTEEAEYEPMESQTSASSPEKDALRRSSSASPRKKSSTPKGRSKEDIAKELRERLKLPPHLSHVEQTLFQDVNFLERRVELMEKQLTQAGIAIAADDITYEGAKAKIAELTQHIMVVANNLGRCSDASKLGQLEAEYGKLSAELEKYTAALMATKEWVAAQIEKERLWEEHMVEENRAALRSIRRHMPVSIRDMSEDELLVQPTPNGKKLSQAMVRKFKRTNILLLLRVDPVSIEPMHPSSLEGLRTTGLTLTERRALHEHLKQLGSKWKTDKTAERKWMWFESLKGKFKQLLEVYEKHVEEFGKPGSHPYANPRVKGSVGCPLLGNQCPVRADAAMDYSGDFGFTPEAQYVFQDVKKHNLLSVEDLQARSNSFDSDQDTSPKNGGGFLAAIASRG